MTLKWAINIINKGSIDSVFVWLLIYSHDYFTAGEITPSGKLLNVYIFSLAQKDICLNYKQNISLKRSVHVFDFITSHSHSYLQSNDTLTSLDLLIVKMSSLFVCIFHPDINFCVNTFGLCLTERTCWSENSRTLHLFPVTIKNDNYAFLWCIQIFQLYTSQHSPFYTHLRTNGRPVFKVPNN